MHMLIAFVIIFVVGFFILGRLTPSSYTGRGLLNDPLAMKEAAIIALPFAITGSLAFGGLWEVIRSIASWFVG